MTASLEFLKRLLPNGLKTRLKQEIIQRVGAPSVEWSLKNMRQLGFRPSWVVDIGAYRGEWTELAHSIFPESSFLMLEAQPARGGHLLEVCQSAPEHRRCRIALLGPEYRAEAIFHEFPDAPTASSVLNGHENPFSIEHRCEMETLDQVLAKEGIGKVDFLKLDVQGYELEVLKGGAGALASAEVVLMEVSLIDFYKNSPLLADVTTFMQTCHFQAYDICSFIRRGRDQALGQVDMIFVKESSALVSVKTW